LSSVLFADPPGPRQHPFGSGQPPVSGQLSATAGGEADHAVPVSCCLSATGVRFLGHPVPPGSSAFLTVGLPAIDWTSTGFPRSARMSPDRGGCLLYPGAVVPTRPEGNVPTGTRRFPTASPEPLPLSIHPAEDRSHEASTKVHAIHPSDLPLARTPRDERRASGFPPSSAPRRYQRRTSERGQALDTGLGSHLRHQPTSFR
jgi:hypothetical protein